MISTNYNDRGYIDTMSERAYMFMLGFYVFIGLLLDILVASATYHWQSPNILMVLLLGLGLPWVGIMIRSTPFASANSAITEAESPSCTTRSTSAPGSTDFMVCRARSCKVLTSVASTT